MGTVGGVSGRPASTHTMPWLFPSLQGSWYLPCHYAETECAERLQLQRAVGRADTINIVGCSAACRHVFSPAVLQTNCCQLQCTSYSHPLVDAPPHESTLHLQIGMHRYQSTWHPGASKAFPDSVEAFRDSVCNTTSLQPEAAADVAVA